MAWSKSLQPKFTRLEEKKKKDSSFYDDYKANVEANKQAEGNKYTAGLMKKSSSSGTKKSSSNSSGSSSNGSSGKSGGWSENVENTYGYNPVDRVRKNANNEQKSQYTFTPKYGSAGNSFNSVRPQNLLNPSIQKRSTPTTIMGKLSGTERQNTFTPRSLKAVKDTYFSAADLKDAGFELFTESQNKALRKLVSQYRVAKSIKSPTEKDSAINRLLEDNRVLLHTYAKNKGIPTNVPEIVKLNSIESLLTTQRDNQRLVKIYNKRMERRESVINNEDFQEVFKVPDRNKGKSYIEDKVNYTWKNAFGEHGRQAGLAYIPYNAETGEVGYGGQIVRAVDDEDVKYLYMTRKEKAIYDYYLYVRKDKKEANKYIEDLKPQLDKRYADAQSKTRSEGLNNIRMKNRALGFAAGAADSLFNSLYGVNAFSDALSQAIAQNTATSENLRPLNANSTGMMGARAAREDRQIIEDGMSPVGKFVTETGLGIAENAARNVILGPVGLPFMAANVAGQTAEQKAAQGEVRADRAAATAAAMGAIEYATEKLPLENFMKILDSPPKTIREFLTTLLKQSGLEGIEGGVSNIVGNIADEMINGDKSEFYQTAMDYRRQGLTMPEALKKAFIDKYVKDTAQSMLGEAISGAVMSGVGTAIGNYNDTIQTGREYNISDNNYEAVRSLVDEGKKSSADTAANKYAKKMQDKLDKGKQLSDWNVGRQVQKNEAAIQNENDFAAAMSKIKPTEIRSELWGVDDNGNIVEINEVSTPEGVKASTNGSQDILTSIKHGWSHQFKMLDPVAYQTYEDSIIKAARETNNKAVDNRINYLMKKHGYSLEKANEEIAAELTSGFNTRAIQRMAEGNRGLVDSVLKAIRTAKSNIRSSFTNGNYKTQTGLEITFRGLNEAEKGYIQGLDKARGNVSENGEVRYSAKDSAPLENRLNGDDLLNAQDTIEDIRRVGGEVDSNGYVTVYHATSKDNADAIRRTGKMIAKEDGIFVSTKPDGEITGYGDNIIQMKIPVENLVADDVFADEMHFRIPLKNRNEVLDVSEYIDNSANSDYKNTENAPRIDFNSKADISAWNELLDEYGYETRARQGDTNGSVYSRLIAELEKDFPLGAMGLADDVITNLGYAPIFTDKETQIYSNNFKNWFGDWQNNPENASKVVNEDGTPKVVYHGTSRGGFTSFDTYGSRFGLFGNGSYFTESRNVANQYTNKGRGDNKQVYEVYLDIKNPINMDENADVSKWNKAFKDNDLGTRARFGDTNEDVYRRLLQELEDEGYEKYEAEETVTDIIQNNMGYDGITHMGGGRVNQDSEQHRVWIAFEPTQIKSATDNIGTFDKNNPDIRYSVKEGNEYTPDKIARRLINENNAKGRVYVKDVREGITELANMVGDVFGDPTQVEGKYTEFEAKARTLAEEIAYASKVTNDEKRELYIELRDFLKGTRIKITNELRSDIPDFNNYRKSLMGTLVLSNDGVPMDVLYHDELQERFPQYFDETKQSRQSDQLIHLVDTLKNLKDYETEVSDKDYDAYVEDLTGQIISDVINASNYDFDDFDYNANTEVGKKLSRLFTNSMQKNFFDDDFRNEAESRIDEFMYKGITNKETYLAAKDAVESMGVDKTLAKLAMKKGGWGAPDTARCLALMAEYRKEGNHAKAVDVYAMARERLTEAGQAIQALKLIDKLSPEGQLIDFERSANRMIEKQINRLSEDEQKQIRSELEEAREKDRQRAVRGSAQHQYQSGLNQQNAEDENNDRIWFHESRYAEEGEINPQDIIDQMPDLPEKEIKKPSQPKQEEKSFVDQVLDDYGIEHIPTEGYDAAANLLELIDKLNTKEDLINLIIEQSKIRKTASHGLVRAALKGEDIEFLKNAAVQQVFGFIADRTPTTVSRKISTFQAMSHLLNARTMNRNITSNTVFDRVDRWANNTAVVADALMGIFTGKRTVGYDRGWLEGLKKDKGGRFKAGFNRARQAYIDTALAVKHGTDNSKYGIQPAKRTFRGRIGGGLERALSYGLTVTDEFQKGAISYSEKKAFDRLKRRGFNDAEIDLLTEQTEKYRTFQDNSLPAQVLNGIKSALNVIGTGDKTTLLTIGNKEINTHEFGLGDIVCKYTTVPGNLISRSIEYSPLGYIKFFLNVGEAIKNKTKGAKFSPQTQRKIALSLARPTTGTGLVAMAALLASAGILVGEREDEDKKQKNLENSEGIENLQINWDAAWRWAKSGFREKQVKQDGDKLMSVGYLEPMNSQLAMGAAIASKDGGLIKPQNWVKAATEKTFDQVLDMPTMSTINQVFNTLQYNDNAGLPEVVIAVGTGGLTGFVPAVVRQTGSFMDRAARNPYNEESELKKAKAQIWQAIPGLRQQVPEKVTPFGETKKNTTGNRVLDFFNNFINPGYIKTYTPTDVSDEVYRLGEMDTDAFPHTPKKKFKYDDIQYSLYGYNYEKYSRMVGQNTLNNYRELIYSDDYKAMSDEDKIAALKKAADKAEKDAQAEYANSRGMGDMFGSIVKPSAIQQADNEIKAAEAAETAKADRKQNLTDTYIQPIVERFDADKFDRDGYSVSGMMNVEPESVKIGNRTYKLEGETQAKVAEAAQELYYDNLEKFFSGEVNVEDVIGLTKKGKYSTVEHEINGTKQKQALSGGRYNADGTERFDDFTLEKIAYRIKDKAIEEAAKQYAEEITGKKASSNNTSTSGSSSKTSSGGTKKKSSSSGKSNKIAKRSSGGSSSRGGSSSSSRGGSSGGGRFVSTARGTTPLQTASSGVFPRSIISSNIFFGNPNYISDTNKGVTRMARTVRPIKSRTVKPLRLA